MVKLNFLAVFLVAIAVSSSSVADSVGKVCGSETSDELFESANQAYKRAADWLKLQQNDQWGWDHTPSIVLALQLTNQTWFNRNDLESQLSVKQLEIELLAHLSVKPIPAGLMVSRPNEMHAGQLAYYILALHSTCHNVTNFYGHDLIHLLERSMRNFPDQEFNNYFQYSVALLALCNSKSQIKYRYVRDVAEGQEEEGGYIDRDTTSMVVTAMSCLAKMPQFTNDVTINSTLRHAIQNLIGCQEADGSFGNIHTSSLAHQALAAAGVPPSVWQCNDVISGILAEQGDDGSFNGDLMTTMQALPSLVGRHYSNMDTQICKVEGNEEEKDVIELLDLNKDGDTISVKISVIDDVNNSKELAMYIVHVPVQTDLFTIMEELSQFTDGAFNYEAEDSLYPGWGHYIQSMYGMQGDNVAQTYWGVYRNYLEPLAVGVDDYYPEDGDHIVFKFVSYADQDW